MEETRSGFGNQSHANDQQATPLRRNQPKAHTPALTPKVKNPRNAQPRTTQLSTRATLASKKTESLNKTKGPHKKNRNLHPNHTTKGRYLNHCTKEHNQRKLAPAERRYAQAPWPTRKTLLNTRRETPHQGSAYRMPWHQGHRNHRNNLQTSELTKTGQGRRQRQSITHTSHLQFKSRYSSA